MKNNIWEKRAKQNKNIKTSPDIGCNILETEFIKRYLKKNQSVLDIGSGDGIATIEFAKMVKHVEGLEPSPTLIEIAKKKVSRAKINNINWREGSILDLSKIYSNPKFDVLISKRVLINLLSWSKQKEAIEQVAKISKKGDLFLLAEGFLDTFKNLQDLRVKYGLERDTVVPFNLFFQRKQFEDFISQYFEVVDQNNLGIYYFLSHFYYPLVIKPEEPKYNSKMNQVATEIALKEKFLEEFGYINFYALKRK